MGKVRISISLEPSQAERVRSHAERAGMDVSAYLVNAATRQMAETEAAEAGFAGIDAVIADAMAQADHYGPADDTDVAALTEDEQRDVDDAMRLVYGQDEDAGRHRGDVA